MSNPDAPRNPPAVHGLIRTSWEQREHWFGWDVLPAAGLAGAGVLLVHSRVLAKALPTLLAAELGLIGAVLGVVIAGLAIVVAFLSREYAGVIVRARSGPMGEFWPFWFVAGVAALAVITAGAGLIVIEQVPSLHRTSFGVTTFLSTYAVLATVNLVALVAQQGVSRAWQLASKPQDE
jgi:hypothetical protein